MRYSKKPIIFIVLVAAVVMFFITRNNVKLEIDEVLFDFRWGKIITDVERAMNEDENYTLLNKLEKIIAYSFKDYKGIDGANGSVVFVCNDKKKLEKIIYYFKDSTDEVKEEVADIFREMLEDKCGKGVTMAGAEMWYDNTMFASIMGGTIAFEDINIIEEELIEELEQNR